MKLAVLCMCGLVTLLLATCSTTSQIKYTHSKLKHGKQHADRKARATPCPTPAPAVVVQAKPAATVTWQEWHTPAPKAPSPSPEPTPKLAPKQEPKRESKRESF